MKDSAVSRAKAAGKRENFVSNLLGRRTMADHSTGVRPRRRFGVHGQLRRAGVSLRSRAGAGALAAQPGRALSERRQRRAQHARALHRSAVLRPSSDARHPAGKRPADRQRPRRQRPRPELAAAGAEEHVRRRASGDHSAHRVSQLEPFAFRGDRHLVHRRPARLRRAPAGSAGISIRCLRRSIRCRRGPPCARRRARCWRGPSACRRFPA